MANVVEGEDRERGTGISAPYHCELLSLSNRRGGARSSLLPAATVQGEDTRGRAHRATAPSPGAHSPDVVPEWDRHFLHAWKSSEQ